MLKKFFILFSLLATVLPELSSAQTVDPEAARYRADQLGSYIHRKEGIMDGNLVKTLFYNTGEVAQWPFSPSGEWPKGTGIDYVDGICMIVTARAKSLRTDRDRYMTPVETFYREEMDITTTVPANLVNEAWGWNPVPGYSNLLTTIPAMSIETSSWPPTWPAALDLPSTYDGNWYGYFGRGIFNADLETFFVMDDSKDAEWTKYPNFFYPIISDAPKKNDGTYDYANGTQWYNPDIRKGLGLRVETRGFQWSQALAEDIIFWHYDISNLGDYDYDSTFFGFYTDTGLGGDVDNGDDNAGYDSELDLTWGYDYDNTISGRPDVVLGVYGYAYLESPGNSNDGRDNDEDGLVDERRDDPDEATELTVTNGKTHFKADEDGDWQPFMDLNGDGVWTIYSAPGAENFSAEPLLDDVGKDGVGAFDEPWDSVRKAFKTHVPDAGEGNGKPNQGEPNYGKLDKDESDQIGLTSVVIEELSGKTVRDIWPRNDEVIWDRMSSAKFDTSIQRKNIQILFGSGPFLLRGAINSDGYGRERFSMALLFGEDKEDLVFNKKTVQIIYNAGYNFTKPPLTPILTARASDKKVYLSWDSRAEESRDPILGYENNDPAQGPRKDFEGYALYRSTEPEFADVKTITNSKGVPQYYKPIKKWDLIDGIEGPDPVGILGAAYYRGDETGLSHAYIDEDVKNGVTYYYALVSYDQGVSADTAAFRIQPTESPKTIKRANSGVITFVDQNCAVVTPNAPALGYVPASFTLDQTPDQGTGTMDIIAVDPGKIRDDVKYKIVFDTTGSFPFYETSGAIVIRNDVDTLGVRIKEDQIGTDINEKATDVFDGVAVQIKNSRKTAVLGEQSTWVSGNPANLPTILAYQTPVPPVSYGPMYYFYITGKSTPNPYYKYFGGDYEIEFFDSMVDTSLKTENKTDHYFQKRPVNFKIKNITSGKYVDFNIWLPLAYRDSVNLVPDGTTKIIIVEYATSVESGETAERWPVMFQYGMSGDENKARPKAGDKFRIRIEKKFVKGDSFTFTTKAESMNKSAAKSALNSIKVVPNPYISAATWEPAQYKVTGRGERKIDFIHLPSTCTIRIYTLSGKLVKTLEKTESLANGAVSWNLISDDGMDVAYGLYIYHVDAPGVGEHIGKFALIK